MSLFQDIYDAADFNGTYNLIYMGKDLFTLRNKLVSDIFWKHRKNLIRIKRQCKGMHTNEGNNFKFSRVLQILQGE